MTRLFYYIREVHYEFMLLRKKYYETQEKEELKNVISEGERRGKCSEEKELGRQGRRERKCEGGKR